MIRHLNDGGTGDTGCYVIACATQGIREASRITTVAREVTCIRCRSTMRFRNHVSRKGWS